MYVDISNKSTSHFQACRHAHACMQANHPNPILDLTVDHTILSTPDPIVNQEVFLLRILMGPLNMLHPHMQALAVNLLWRKLRLKKFLT